MADDQSATPGFNDYSAAMDRLRAAKEAGQAYDPSDVDIVRRGAASHSQNYDAAQQPSASPAAAAPAAPATPPPPAGPAVGEKDASGNTVLWRATPNEGPWDWNNMIARGLAAPVDWAIAGANVPGQLYGAIRGEDAPYHLRSATDVLQIPPRPENISGAQGTAEDYGPLAAAVAAPFVAGASELAAVPLAFAGAKAGLSAFLGPRAAEVGRSAGEAIDPAHPERWGDPLAWLAGTAAGAAPDVATGAMGKSVAAHGAPNAGAIADAWESVKNYFKNSGIETPQMMQGKGEVPTSWLLQGQGKAIGRNVGKEQSLAESLADLVSAKRGELPTPTPENEPLVGAAQNAAITKGVVYPGVEDWFNDHFGNNPIDVTKTANLLQQIADPNAPLPAGMNRRTTQDIKGATSQLNLLQNFAKQDAQGNWTADFGNFRGWRSDIGNAIGNETPIAKGATYSKVYGQANEDMMNAGPRYGVDPSAVKQAFDIEHGQSSADALAALFAGKQIGTNPAAKYPLAPLAKTIDPYKFDPGEYARMFGGKYEFKGAPPPTGPGDIRELTQNIDTLAHAAGPPTAHIAPGFWGKVYSYGPSMIGLASKPLEALPEALSRVAGLEYLKEKLPEWLMDMPAVRQAIISGQRAKGVPLGVLPGLAKSATGGYTSGIGEEGQQPPGPPPTGPGSYNPWLQGPGVVPKGPQPPAYNPWLPVSPRSGQRLGALPTTRPILAAFNGANVGNPRSITG